MDKRPELTNEISILDFEDFYWLKNELIKFCREEGLIISGSKIELTERIIHYLKTGNKLSADLKKKTKITSKFDWQNDELSLQTIITDNYQNTENVRAFFKENIGKQFKFNVKFMDWMKTNQGRTLKDSITAWKQTRVENKLGSTPKVIEPQFEYNTYIRDFLADNPSLKRNQAIKCWKLKKLVRGNNRYKKEDLKFLEDE